MKINIKKRLGWLEAGLYIGGVALIAVFFQIRADGERLKEDGLQAFRSSVESEVVIADPNSGESVKTQILLPNQELWAEKRINEYEESLKVAADPPLAIFSIDRLDIQVPVFNGADDFNLNRGVGRIKGTAAIDTDGNLGIAGHRDGFFRGLKDIEVGDRIELLSANGSAIYAVDSIQIVDPSDVSVLNPTDDRTITLVTCYPFYYVGHAPKRFIVKAKAEQFNSETKVREL
jgi:sortase A